MPRFDVKTEARWPGVQGNFRITPIFVVRRSPEDPPEWLQDQVFLFVTVRGQGSHGQDLCLATYHAFG